MALAARSVDERLMDVEGLALFADAHGTRGVLCTRSIGIGNAVEKEAENAISFLSAAATKGLHRTDTEEQHERAQQEPLQHAPCSRLAVSHLILPSIAAYTQRLSASDYGCVDGALAGGAEPSIGGSGGVVMSVGCVVSPTVRDAAMSSKVLPSRSPPIA